MARELPHGVVAGVRVRDARKLRGWTQEQLSVRMHVSTSLVRAVEQGRAPASPQFVNSAAAALGLTPADLYGQTEPLHGRPRRELAALEGAIEAGADLVSDAPPPEPSAVFAWVDEIALSKRAARYSDCVRALPEVLEALHQLEASTLGNTEDIAAQLSRAYNLAMHVLYRLGSATVMLAAERAIAAAQRSGDPYLLAYQHIERALPLLHRGQLGPAQRILTQVFHDLNDAPRIPQVISVTGFAHLRMAIVDARADRSAPSDMHLDEAQLCADQLPQYSDIYGGAFNTTNVTIHRVGAAVDSNRPDVAVERNRPMPAGILLSRQAHHHVDLARAYLLLGNDQASFRTLMTGRAIGMELIRHHPQVHETIAALVRRERRRSDTTAAFAAWAGVRV